MCSFNEFKSTKISFPRCRVISLASRVNCNGQHEAVNAQTRVQKRLAPHYWKKKQRDETIRGLEWNLFAMSRILFYVYEWLAFWHGVKSSLGRSKKKFSGRKVSQSCYLQAEIKFIEIWNLVIMRNGDKNAFKVEVKFLHSAETTCHS